MSPISFKEACELTIAEYIRSGKHPLAADSTSEGGYLVPETYIVPKKGLLSWFLRLMNNENGCIVYHPLEELKEAVRLLRISRSNP